MIQKIEVYKTSDGQLFEDIVKANAHQEKNNLKDEIIQLLGGTNDDICPNNSSFSNGKGYFLISKENFDKAIILIKKLLQMTDQESYSITSKACYENEYTTQIGAIYASLYFVHDSIKRFGQPYFVSHPSEVGTKNYTK